MNLLGHALHQLGKRLNRAAPVQRLARAVVQQVSDRIERLLVMHRQVRALGQELAQQPVGVLAAALLPRAVRVAEIHADVGVARQLLMLAHLAPLVVGERLAKWLRDLVELGGEGRQRRLGRCIGHARQQYQARGALDQHAHAGAVHGAFDEVALPMARHGAVVHLGRAQVDADHVGDLAAPVLATRAGAAGAAALAQAGDEGLAQLTLGVGVDGVVDALVRDVHAGLVGPKGAECAGDLLGGPVPAEHVADDRPQGAVGVELDAAASKPATARGQEVRAVRGVALGAAVVALEFPAQGAGAAPQLLGNGTQAMPLQPQRRHRDALFSLQLLECSGHLDTLRGWRGVALQT